MVFCLTHEHWITLKLKWFIIKIVYKINQTEKSWNCIEKVKFLYHPTKKHWKSSKWLHLFYEKFSSKRKNLHTVDNFPKSKQWEKKKKQCDKQIKFTSIHFFELINSSWETIISSTCELQHNTSWDHSSETGTQPANSVRTSESAKTANKQTSTPTLEHSKAE